VRNRPDLLIAYDFPPLGGGIARLTSEIARRYPAGDLVISTGRLPGDSVADQDLPNVVDRVAVPSGRLRTLGGQFRWARRLFDLHRRFDFRFAWCDNVRPSAYPGYFLRRWRQLPYGVLLYGSDLFDLRRNYRRSRFKRLIARRLLGEAAAIVTISRWTNDLAREVLGELDLSPAIARLRIVPLGTDPDRFHAAVDGSKFRHARGLPEGRWLLTVARVERFKGVDVGIQALRLLAERYPDLHYGVVGQGPARPELEAMARAEGIADRVHFLGLVPDAELPEAYSLATIYLGLTRETEREVEGFGISLVEAQACGRPVIAGRGGGTGDAVQDGRTGLLVDPRNPSAVADAIDGLLEHPDRAAAMGAAGRAEVERYYHWDRVVGDLRAIATELATVARGKPGD
jgi:phosphatidyl-myo-inositol dimannoside synthase